MFELGSVIVGLFVVLTVQVLFTQAWSRGRGVGRPLVEGIHSDLPVSSPSAAHTSTNSRGGRLGCLWSSCILRLGKLPLGWSNIPPCRLLWPVLLGYSTCGAASLPLAIPARSIRMEPPVLTLGFGLHRVRSSRPGSGIGVQGRRM